MALTEFALVLPILMLLLLGMLDFGKAFNYWIDQTHLANMGARWAVVNKNPGASASPALTLQEYIAAQANTDELKSGGTSSIPTSSDAATACISFPNGTSAVGDPVQVKVKANYHFLGFVSSKVGLLEFQIEGKATMRLEQKPTNYFPNAC